MLGNDPYRYPDNLPIVAAKGGPGGKPGCGSLPDVSKNFPVRQLITNTGWGTGLDIRPNPGIGHPCYAELLPRDPRGARAARDPRCIRAAGDRAGAVSRGAALRRAAVRAGRNAAVAGRAARTPRPAGPAPTPRPHRAHRRSAATACYGATPMRTGAVTDTTLRREPVRETSARVWRLAVFVAVCLLGAFALVMVFAQLRFREGHRPTPPSSPTSPV